MNSVYCAKRILRPLRVGPAEIHVCKCVCTDLLVKLPRGSKGVTALWPRGVLNEMIRNSQKKLFLDQFQTRPTLHISGLGSQKWSLFTVFGSVSNTTYPSYLGIAGLKNDHFSLFFDQFQTRVSKWTLFWFRALRAPALQSVV